MKNWLINFLLFVAGAITGVFVFQQSANFSSLNLQEMQTRIVKERDFAIQKAIEAGVYKCCITPPCTMCFMEANHWNNQIAGTCDCDTLIAQGKEPCPQCVAGLCEKSDNGNCEVNKN